VNGRRFVPQTADELFEQLQFHGLHMHLAVATKNQHRRWILLQGKTTLSRRSLEVCGTIRCLNLPPQKRIKR
jgi:hypothetical protein